MGGYYFYSYIAQQLGLDASKFIPSNYVDIINTVFAILTMLGIVVDTSTSGISDQTSTTNSTDSVKTIITATNTTRASSKVTVDNPDDIKEIGATVNATSAVSPN